MAQIPTIKVMISSRSAADGFPRVKLAGLRRTLKRTLVERRARARIVAGLAWSRERSRNEGLHVGNV